MRLRLPDLRCKTASYCLQVIAELPLTYESALYILVAWKQISVYTVLGTSGTCGGLRWTHKTGGVVKCGLSHLTSAGYLPNQRVDLLTISGWLCWIRRRWATLPTPAWNAPDGYKSVGFEPISFRTIIQISVHARDAYSTDKSPVNYVRTAETLSEENQLNGGRRKIGCSLWNRQK